MAPRSSTLAWKIPWTEEPGRMQSMGSLRVGHNWATSLSLFTFMHWRRKWQPIPVFLPGESQGRGAWWAAVCGVAQSRTRLKRLSSSPSLICAIAVVPLHRCIKFTCSPNDCIWVVSKHAIHTLILFHCVCRPNCYLPGQRNSLVFWVNVATSPSTKMTGFIFN